MDVFSTWKVSHCNILETKSDCAHADSISFQIEFERAKLRFSKILHLAAGKYIVKPQETLAVKSTVVHYPLTHYKFSLIFRTSLSC